LVIIPAARSSATTPKPPGIRLSRSRIGNGLKISRILNMINPITTVIGLKGNPTKATTMPAISSITIQPGSFCSSIFSAASAIQTAKNINNRVHSIAGAADIPMTRFLGQSPGGFDSTGDSDLKNYYDAVASIQTLQLTPALNGIDEALIRSALGNRPDDVSYEWASLWQMSDEQRSKISLQTAQTIGELVDSGLFMEDDLAQAAANVLVEHSILPSFEFSEAAEPDPDEAGMPQSTQQE